MDNDEIIDFLMKVVELCGDSQDDLIVGRRELANELLDKLITED